MDVDGTGGPADVVVEVVEVVDEGEADAGSGVQAGLLEGGDLLPRVAADAKAVGGGAEEGEEVGGGPAGIAAGGPVVVVEAAAPDRGAAVVRGAAADDAGSLEGNDAVCVGVGAVVFPGVGVAEGSGVEQALGPAAGGEGTVVGAGFKQKDGPSGVFGEETGDGGTGAASANDDCVGVAGEGGR